MVSPPHATTKRASKSRPHPKKDKDIFAKLKIILETLPKEFHADIDNCKIFGDTPTSILSTTLQEEDKALYMMMMSIRAPLSTKT